MAMIIVTTTEFTFL